MPRKKADTNEPDVAQVPEAPGVPVPDAGVLLYKDRSGPARNPSTNEAQTYLGGLATGDAPVPVEGA